MSTKSPVALSFDELKALLMKAREHNDTRSYVLFLIAASHGLRVSEVINLKRLNFATTTGVTYLRVQRLKGSKLTIQKLQPNEDPLFDEQTVVTEYISKMKPGQFLFTNKHGERLTRWGVNFLLGQYAEWAGIPEWKRFPHVLKHTLGVRMRQTGAKLEEIKEALGHEKLDSTAQYLRVTQEEVDDARSRAFSADAAMAARVGG